MCDEYTETEEERNMALQAFDATACIINAALQRGDAMSHNGIPFAKDTEDGSVGVCAATLLPLWLQDPETLQRKISILKTHEYGIGQFKKAVLYINATNVDKDSFELFYLVFCLYEMFDHIDYLEEKCEEHPEKFEPPVFFATFKRKACVCNENPKEHRYTIYTNATDLTKKDILRNVKDVFKRWCGEYDLGEKPRESRDLVCTQKETVLKKIQDRALKLKVPES